MDLWKHITGSLKHNHHNNRDRCIVLRSIAGSLQGGWKVEQSTHLMFLEFAMIEHGTSIVIHKRLLICQLESLTSLDWRQLLYTGESSGSRHYLRYIYSLYNLEWENQPSTEAESWNFVQENIRTFYSNHVLKICGGAVSWIVVLKPISENGS